jgi:hypothetical protein
VLLITLSLSDQRISRAAFDNGDLVDNRGAMVAPEYTTDKRRNRRVQRLKKISVALKNDVEGEIKAILHASRDCLRNQKRLDTSKVSFSANDGYYGEAFGVMRGLQILGYGYFGSSNLDAVVEAQSHYRIGNVTSPEQNLKWWFSNIEQEVLEEENFKGDHHCDHCMDKYRKDTRSVMDTGRTDFLRA